MSYSYATRQFKTTDISADVDELATTTEASNSATIARYAAAGAVISRRFDPGSTTGPSAAVPAVNTAAAGQGWRENPAQVNSPQADAYTVEAGNWTITLRVRRSGQALEVDQNSDVTVIAYRVSSTGVHQAEIGRATVRFTWTTTATDRAFTFDPGAIAFAANNRAQLEVYVVPLNALNDPTAPAVATDLIIQVGAAADSRIAHPNYTIQFARPTADTASAADALTRSAGRFARTTANTAAAADVLTRSTGRFSRPTADTASASDVLTRSAGRFARPTADTAAASDVLTRSAGRFARAIADTAGATDSLGRKYSSVRAVADTASASDALSRVYTAVRATANTIGGSDVLSRSVGVFARATADTASASDSLSRLINYGRSMQDSAGGAFDWPLQFPTKAIAGVVRDTASNPVEGAVVKLYRTSDDVLIATTTSAANGAYSFTRDLFDPYEYYAVAYEDGSPDLAGRPVNTLVGV